MEVLAGQVNFKGQLAFLQKLFNPFIPVSAKTATSQVEPTMHPWGTFEFFTIVFVYVLGGGGGGGGGGGDIAWLTHSICWF